MVTFLRKGYRGQMRFFRDDYQTVTSVFWFLVPKGRAGMPFDHAFGSYIWPNERDPDWAIGDVTNRNPPYYGAGDVWGYVGGGPCGTEFQWQNGALAADARPPNQPGRNVPVCCASASTPPSHHGGLVTGGAGLVRPVGPLLPGGVIEGGAGLVEGEALFPEGGTIVGGVGTVTPYNPLPIGGTIVGRTGLIQFEPFDGEGGTIVGGHGEPVAGQGIHASGGTIVGGGGIVKVRSTGCGSTDLPACLKLTRSAATGGCTCLPTLLHFWWNGTVWACIDSNPNYCGTGQNTTSWFITSPSVAIKWQLHMPSQLVNGTGSTCSPPATTYNSLTGTQCSGGTGTFSYVQSAC